MKFHLFDQWAYQVHLLFDRDQLPLPHDVSDYGQMILIELILMTLLLLTKII